MHNTHGEELITAYAVHRPDGQWSLLLINKDPKRAYETSMVFSGISKISGVFKGPIDVFQYSSLQYLLGGSAAKPYPVKADQPEHRVVPSRFPKATQITLPPYSLTVIRGGLNQLWFKYATLPSGP